MKFRDYFSAKQIIFAVVLFAILIPIAFWDSDTQVKLSYYEEYIYVDTDKYDMSIRYEDVVSAELTELAEPGEEVEDSWDNDIIRVGIWKNETWGEYIVCADLDCSNCILLQLQDGRILVYSQKDNQTTSEAYATLLTYLPNA